MSFVEIQSACWAVLSLLIATFIRSIILAILCGVLVLLLRSRAAALRHLVWRGMLFALLLLPILQTVEPPLRRPSRMVTRVESAIVPAVPKGTVTAFHVTPGAMIGSPPVDLSAEPVWPVLVISIYLAISFLLFSRTIGGLTRAGKIAGQSWFIEDANVRELAHEAWLLCGAGLKPRVRESEEITVPVAVECGEPFILLPTCWREWDMEKLRAVMMHEMAHVTRDDPNTALWSSITTCFFWFHPLAWFLRRRLALLAEEACDKFALKTISSPEQYARVLVDFSRDLAATGGRILVSASAVVRGSQMKARMRGIFSISQPRKGSANAIRIALAAVFLPSLYLAAAAHFDDPAGQNSAASALPSSNWMNLGWNLTPEQISQLESQLQANPEDLAARAKLLSYYMQQAQSSGYLPHLFWVMEHHPESPILDWAITFIAAGGLLNTPADYEPAKALWEANLAKYPASPAVLLHAGMFFERKDEERAAKLFEKAYELEPSNPKYLFAVARVYTKAEMNGLSGRNSRTSSNPELAAILRGQLQDSNDPALLSKVGTMLAQILAMEGTDKQMPAALELLERAVTLDPANPKWKEALESAKAEPIRQQNQALTPGQPGAIRIGAKVAEANLLNKVEPQYPPLARSARVQGTVEFTVTIGPDGHVENIQLVRGHPLLVNAAKDAVQQWIYRPTLLNGNPVAVVADVFVAFVLPE